MHISTDVSKITHQLRGLQKDSLSVSLTLKLSLSHTIWCLTHLFFTFTLTWSTTFSKLYPAYFSKNFFRMLGDMSAGWLLKCVKISTATVCFFCPSMIKVSCASYQDPPCNIASWVRETVVLALYLGRHNFEKGNNLWKQDQSDLGKGQVGQPKRMTFRKTFKGSGGGTFSNP